MSTTTVTNNVQAPPAKRSMKEPWDYKEMKKQFKELRDFLKKVSDGLHIIPNDQSHVDLMKINASEVLALVDKVLEEYKQLCDSTESKRTTKIKPRLCDKKLTTFLANYYKKYIPDNGVHGIFDLNTVAPRAVSQYIKDKGLGNTQFFTLDHELYTLFNSPSVENPSKTYIQLAQERITEIRMTSGYEQSTSSAEILLDNSRITMNYSALKIIIPKFGINYELTNPEQYVPQLEDFDKYLIELRTKYEENRKAEKKNKKTK
jgi:hypothetical protein